MLNFLTGIKEKLILVMGTIIAALLAYTRIQSTRMKKQTDGYEKERQDRMKELYETNYMKRIYRKCNYRK